MTTERRVVITGLGVACPHGIGVSSFWDALIEGRSAVGEIRRFDASTLPSPLGAEMPEFKIGDFVPKSYRKATKLMSRDIVLSVVAAHQAAMDAKLPTKCLVDRGEAEVNGIDPVRFGVNIGAGLICPDLDELGAAFVTAVGEDGLLDLKAWGQSGMQNLTPLWLLKFLPNMLACHTSIIHDAQAMSNTITCGEASSHLAIGEAFRNIARGLMDVCICGGAESKINPMNVTRPALMKRLVTEWTGDPAGACKPFAAGRCGTVASEGAGIVILESLEHAQRRGARIYAEIAGLGASANIHDWDAPDPTGAGIALAMRNALRDSKRSPENVDLVAPFGTGIPDHDASEAAAYRDVFGDRLAECAALAIKGGLGNNGAGSGALDFAAAVLAMHYNTVPPSPNTDPRGDDSPFGFTQGDPIDRRVDTAMSTAYSLGGGQNTAIVVKRMSEA